MSFTRKVSTPSFTRKGGGTSSSSSSSIKPSPTIRMGPHGTSLVSSGFSDLDQVIGGGIPVGGIVMVMEDLDTPHHLLLLRFFMAQGLLHEQPVLFASPMSNPQSFLGTLPGIAKSKDSTRAEDSAEKIQQGGDGLRIAWQYRKFLSEQQALEDRRQRQQELNAQSRSNLLSQPLVGKSNTGPKLDYCNSFDLRRPLERTVVAGGKAECLSLSIERPLDVLDERCRGFLVHLSSAGSDRIGRVAVQSLCAPQCADFMKDWKMLKFLHSLKGMLRASNAAAMITFPASLLSHSFCVRWQHMADILLAVESIPDESKELAAMLTDYHEMVGFLRILKTPSINTQVRIVPDSAVYAFKLRHRKSLVLERLNQAPVDLGSTHETSTPATALCGKPANATSTLDF